MATATSLPRRSRRVDQAHEDGRFLHGTGNYVEDVVLPNMLHMAILRSPFAHARIRSIETSEANAAPGVVAVVTGADLVAHKLAWMPTLSGDTQAVLATDKVRMQGQEVACVIAETPYQAHDALGLIEVDYDPLPAVTSPQQALEDGAPLIRDEKEGQTDNRVYDWEAGDKAATDRAFAEADRVIEPEHLLHPRSPPGAAGVLRLRRRRESGQRQGDHLHDLAGAACPPDGLRPGHRPARAEHPDHLAGHRRRLRQQGSVYPGYVVATAASLLIGRPVKWIEDRTENLISTGFARDYHMNGELALKKDGKMLGLRVRMLSDRELCLRGRAAEQVQGRPLPHRHRLLRHPRGARRRRRRVHQQGARRRGLPVLVPGHRGVVPDRAAGRQGRHGDRDGPWPSFEERTSLQPTLPLTRRPRASSTTPATTSRRSTSRSRSSATGSCARSRSACGRVAMRTGSCSASAWRASPRWSAPVPAGSSTSSASRCSTPPSCGCTRRARRSSSSA